MVEFESQEAALDRTFAALSDPTRRAILTRLAAGDARVGELADPFEISLAAVSKHLQVLERAGLIQREAQGRERRCHLDARPLSRAAAWTERYRGFWEGRLDALERHLTPPPRRTGPRRRRR